MLCLPRDIVRNVVNLMNVVYLIEQVIIIGYTAILWKQTTQTCIIQRNIYRNDDVKSINKMYL
jgi:hypothetical protein